MGVMMNLFQRICFVCMFVTACPLLVQCMEMEIGEESTQASSSLSLQPIVVQKPIVLSLTNSVPQSSNVLVKKRPARYSVFDTLDLVFKTIATYIDVDGINLADCFSHNFSMILCDAKARCLSLEAALDAFDKQLNKILQKKFALLKESIWLEDECAVLADQMKQLTLKGKKISAEQVTLFDSKMNRNHVIKGAFGNVVKQENVYRKKLEEANQQHAAWFQKYIDLKKRERKARVHYGDVQEWVRKVYEKFNLSSFNQFSLYRPSIKEIFLYQDMVKGVRLLLASNIPTIHESFGLFLDLFPSDILKMICRCVHMEMYQKNIDEMSKDDRKDYKANPALDDVDIRPVYNAVVEMRNSNNNVCCLSQLPQQLRPFLGIILLFIEPFAGMPIKKLFLNSNELAVLPTSLRYLCHLEELDVYDNNLNALPEELLTIPTLERLGLRKNCFKGFPIALLNRVLNKPLVVDMRDNPKSRVMCDKTINNADLEEKKPTGSTDVVIHAPMGFVTDLRTNEIQLGDVVRKLPILTMLNKGKIPYLAHDCAMLPNGVIVYY